VNNKLRFVGKAQNKKGKEIYEYIQACLNPDKKITASITQKCEGYQNYTQEENPFVYQDGSVIDNVELY